MFLHIGGEDIILKKDIIAIIDNKSINKSQINKDLIKKNQGLIKKIHLEGKEKSYIIGHNKIYESSISSFTLKKRSDNFLENMEN